MSFDYDYEYLWRGLKNLALVFLCSWEMQIILSFIQITPESLSWLILSQEFKDKEVFIWLYVLWFSDGLEINNIRVCFVVFSWRLNYWCRFPPLCVQVHNKHILIFLTTKRRQNDIFSLVKLMKLFTRLLRRLQSKRIAMLSRWNLRQATAHYKNYIFWGLPHENWKAKQKERERWT